MYSSNLGRQSMSMSYGGSPSLSSSIIPPMSPTSTAGMGTSGYQQGSTSSYPYSPPPTSGFGASPPTSPFGMGMGAGHASSAATAYVASIQSPSSMGSHLPRHSLPPQPSLLGNSSYHSHHHYNVPTSPIQSPSYGYSAGGHHNESSLYQSRLYTGSVAGAVGYTSPHLQRSFGRRSEEMEPMSVSPPAGSIFHQGPNTAQGVQFLPSYLTGESSPIKPSGSTPTKQSESNKLGYVSDLFGVKSPVSSSASLRKSMGGPLFHQNDNFTEDNSSTIAKKDGPPVTGFGSGDENNLNFLVSGSPAQVSPENASKLTNHGHGHNSITSPATSGTGTPKEIPMKFSSSTTSNNSPTPSEWVTVFGFPSSALSTITSQFSLYGSILETKTNPGSNWVHLKYSNKIEARRALNKNGTVIAGSMMVGVLPCDEALAIAGRPPGSNIYYSPSGSSGSGTSVHGGSSSNTSIFPASAGAKGSSVRQVRHSTGPNTSGTCKENIDPSSSSSAKSRMRPMTATGPPPGKTLTTTPISAPVPQANSGLLSKAMEYLFGW